MWGHKCNNYAYTVRIGRPKKKSGSVIANWQARHKGPEILSSSTYQKAT
jgi:hypothetical protein